MIQRIYSSTKRVSHRKYSGKPLRVIQPMSGEDKIMTKLKNVLWSSMHYISGKVLREWRIISTDFWHVILGKWWVFSDGPGWPHRRREERIFALWWKPKSTENAIYRTGNRSRNNNQSQMKIRPDVNRPNIFEMIRDESSLKLKQYEYEVTFCCEEDYRIIGEFKASIRTKYA